MLVSVLGEEGYQVIPASGGPEALALAPVERPDVVLVDLMMPGMDGRTASTTASTSNTAIGAIAAPTAASGASDSVAPTNRTGSPPVAPRATCASRAPCAGDRTAQTSARSRSTCTSSSGTSTPVAQA